MDRLPPQHVTLLSLLQYQNQLVNAVDFVFDALDEWTEGIGDVVDQRVRDPVRSHADVVFQLLDSPSYTLRMRSWTEVELSMMFSTCEARSGEMTYREYPLAEDDDVHIERLQICGTHVVLLETTETNEIIVAEQLDLLTRFFHLDIFSCKGMDGKDLIRYRQ